MTFFEKVGPTAVCKIRWSSLCVSANGVPLSVNFFTSSGSAKNPVPFSGSASPVGPTDYPCLSNTKVKTVFVNIKIPVG